MGEIEIIDLVYKFGAIPLMIWLIWSQTKKIDQLESKVDKINEEHKTDLKKHTTELKTLIQNVSEYIRNKQNG